MMKKTAVAFDIGESYIKIAQRKGSKIMVEAVQMPENLIRDGVIQMPNVLTDFLKNLKQEQKLPKGPCGIVVPDEVTVCRPITMPVMTEAQLEVNLPFEFSDYISNDPQRYVYDYAIQEIRHDEEGKPIEMELMGAVMSKEEVSGYVNIYKNAKMNLRTLIPEEIALGNIMRLALEEGRIEKDKEYCIINLGHRSTQVYIYKGDRQTVIRNLHVGNDQIDKVIAENKNVDEFLARTYKNNNYQQILEESFCQEAFGRVAIEIMKVINFYRFNNRETELEDVYFCGGGSNIEGLCATIADTVGMNAKNFMELMPNDVDKQCNPSGVFAIGVLMQ